MRFNRFVISLLCMFMLACSSRKIDYKTYDEYPATTSNLWLDYSKDETIFKIWSPTAEQVFLNLYKSGSVGKAIFREELEFEEDGVWSLAIKGDLNGKYYTFEVEIDGQTLSETPGIYAQTVGVNGKRAMVLDLDQTNPSGWELDKGPNLNHPNEAIIYEMHIRDISSHLNSGIKNSGKYIGFTEKGSTGPEGVTTGLDHLKDMGITHVHLLPSFDYFSVDESRLNTPQFNWGYDPVNYNVPEGSYATDPSDGMTRIKEYKQMVQALHEQNIGVIMDVVYNHTFSYEGSNFNLEVPGYYYRHKENGELSNASACGNETASNREMMRKFMIESVSYWAKEYHIDGFRFDLMGIHDIETMNLITAALKEINPNIMVYGEGWTAGDSPFPPEKRAFKVLTSEMPQVSAFSDEIRDGLKGSWADHKQAGFISGKKDTEASVKMGIVGCIDHPQIDYKKVNTSDAPWAKEPWQAVNYVSCHDNHTLYDKLKISRPDASEDELIAMHKLANAVVLTSQGIPFLHAGVEMLRTKKGVENSYKSPDSINQIDWQWKVKNAKVVDYYKNLIRLRKAHPAFYMPTAEDVRANLEFKRSETGLISYQINNQANGDLWKTIHVIYNATPKERSYDLPGTWNLAVVGDDFDSAQQFTDRVNVPAISMLIAYQN